ncbi:uncharacterized protein LOC119766868 [Culex quinquefasciatus]|uniref:uncharacterized protein LOC119766868 n=1 Tax=Culex quinquefasciatus TaxID=7176 RepID=UPI0018E2D266|nr:uncharacterized protein LOC119766868 [Culex quinquefasciatus]
MPHHAVLRPSSTSTKLRVVFDASAKSSSGTSLNDLLMVGPPVQDSLFAILLRFRLCPYVLSSDLSKMYRQIRIDPDHSSFQRIFWREKPTDPLKVYGLSTVTYGTASAPFLATRTLVQLAEDEQKEFPIGAKLLKESFYVDDCLCGFETFPVLTKISSFRKLQRVFGFVLRFVDNCRRKDNRVVSDHLTIGELRRSLKALVRLAQHTSSIGSDFKRMERGDPCKQVQSLNPFIEDGVIRVGGRIQKSNLLTRPSIR